MFGGSGFRDQDGQYGKKFKNFLFQNQVASCNGTYSAASGTQAHHSLSYDPGLTLTYFDLFKAKVKFDRLGKSENYLFFKNCCRL